MVRLGAAVTLQALYLTLYAASQPASLSGLWDESGGNEDRNTGG